MIEIQLMQRHEIKYTLSCVEPLDTVGDKYLVFTICVHQGVRIICFLSGVQETISSCQVIGSGETEAKVSAEVLVENKQTSKALTIFIQAIRVKQKKS